MNFNDYNKFVGKIGTFVYNNELIQIRINEIEMVSGNLWLTYTFMTHQHLSPTLYGVNLNRANCCLDDTHKGWFSKEILNTFQVLSNP